MSSRPPPSIFKHAPTTTLSMASITPFKVAISEDKIKRLQQKLASTDFPSEVLDPNNPWSRGVPLSEIKRLAFYWQHNFDWRSAEAKLNTLPQYIANINIEGFDKYDIHFVHQRSQITDAIPLLFLHGWPSSFLEVTHMLPLLVDGGKEDPSFHVVAPSLIDFGFSSASKMVYFCLLYSKNADTGKKGFNVDQHAEAYHKLMLSLGYNEYGTPPLSIFWYKVLTVRSHSSRRPRVSYHPFHCFEVRTEALQSIPHQQRSTCRANRLNTSRTICQDQRHSSQQLRSRGSRTNTRFFDPWQRLLSSSVQ